MNLSFPATLPRIRALGTRIGRAAHAGDVIALVGPLGAGKTTLAQSIARGVGVPPSVRVQSPTFALVQEYTGRLKLFHADLYRLGSVHELDDLGLLERSAEALVVIEWADRFPEAIPENALWITLAHAGPTLRSVHLGVEGEADDRWTVALAG